MIRSKLFSACAFAVLAFGGFSSTQAIDPVYGFPFGYSLGYQFSFRNRLPTPPYFAIHPPVYYGARHVRPYGESPYASFPLLGSLPDYGPVPAVRTAAIERTITNPHAEPCCAEGAEPAQDKPQVQIVAESPVGKPRLIVNPFAQEQEHVATKD